VVKTAVRCGKALEINNSSFKVRKGSLETCTLVAGLCKQYGCLVSCGSDAHYWADVGNFNTARTVIAGAGISEGLLINSTMESFTEFYRRRKTERVKA
jgi:putative hydrolase